MPPPKKADAKEDAPKTDVRYVTLDGARVARSATPADAQKYIDEITNEPEGVLRVRAAHGMPPANMCTLDVEPGFDGEVY